MKTKIFFLIVSFVIMSSLVGSNVLAQENVDIDVTADEDITHEDLGVSEPKTLPDSPFYFVKNLWRGIRTTFTFNPVSKAELQLRFANERLIEAKKLAEKTDKEEIFKKTLEKYQGGMEKIKNRVEKFKEKAADNPKIDAFLDRFTDKTMKQQRLMDKLEKQLSDKPEVLEKIRSNKERALEHFGEVMNKLEEKDKIPERLDKNLEKIEGSKFKNFKNLEVLIRLEEKVPEQAKEAIKQAQENALKRLHGNLEEMSPEDQEKFSEYLENVGGDQTTQLRILERIKEEKPTPVLRQKIEQNRQMIQERVQSIEKDTLQLRERIQEQVQEQTREQTKEQSCITLWAPVCGKDGKTYSNTCFAKLSGVEIAYKGRCKIEEPKENPIIEPIEEPETPTEEPIKSPLKYCAANSDCVIKYNVKYNGKCSAGCFNTIAEIDKWCNENIKHELFPPGTFCECLDGECVLVEVENPIEEPIEEDNIPPVITITQPENDSIITTDSIVIKATTDENANCQSQLTVSSGTGVGQTNWKTMDDTGGTLHSQQLTNLRNGNTYKIDIECSDSVGNKNSISVSFSVDLGTPDLTIIEIILSPSDPNINDILEMTAVIYNAGDGPANGAMSVSCELIYPSSEKRSGGGGGPSSIEARRTKNSGTCGYPLTESGTYTITMKVDPDDVIKESNDNNNEKTRTLTVP